MRALLAPGITPGAPLGADDLRALYAFPSGPHVRANFVASLDGAAAGADGRSGSINTLADREVFALNRSLADVVLVGAGTARVEDYGPAGLPLAVVSNTGVLPPRLAGHATLITCAAAGLTPGETVWVCGAAAVDLAEAVARLSAAGMPRILCEGGPTLLGGLVAAGLVGSWAVTTSPRVVSGHAGRPVVGLDLDVPLRLRHLLEADGTLLALWDVR